MILRVDGTTPEDRHSQRIKVARRHQIDLDDAVIRVARRDARHTQPAAIHIAVERGAGGERCVRDARHRGERRQHFPLKLAQAIAFVDGPLRIDCDHQHVIAVEAGFDVREVQQRAQDEHGGSHQHE